MTKKKIVDLTNEPLHVLASSVIKAIIPVGNQVLVERLTESELSTSSLHLTGGEKSSNQGYVLALGPQVNREYGIKVGDRVLLQGNFVPVPNFDDSKREKNLLLPDYIKAILVE